MASNKSRQNKTRLIGAMGRNLSNVSKACHEVGVTRKTFYSYLKTDECFKSALEELLVADSLQGSGLDADAPNPKQLTQHHSNHLQAMGKLGSAAYDYVLSERDFEDYVIDNLSRIASLANWSPIRRVERQFRLPVSGRRYAKVDVMAWHTDGSGTVIECKVPNGVSTYELYAIGQLMLYGSVIKTQMGQYPRLVMCAPSISPVFYRVVKEFRVPIHLLQIDNDECVYLP